MTSTSISGVATTFQAPVARSNTCNEVEPDSPTSMAAMLPSFYSHVIAATTLAVPGIIIAETSLSFLGLGLKPPAISWGVLMFEAQNIETIALAPWLLLPGVFVIVSVLAFNFMGNGIRDAADPYSVQRN